MVQRKEASYSTLIIQRLPFVQVFDLALTIEVIESPRIAMALIFVHTNVSEGTGKVGCK